MESAKQKKMRTTQRPEVENDATGPNWLELPRDITAKILKCLGVVEILMNARQVCPLWWNICNDPLMWRTIDMRDRGTLPCSTYKKICYYAIDQSRGLLEDYSVRHFGSDSLLTHIANSTSQLRRLRLVNCFKVSDQGLSEVANKLPLLEELDISYSFLSKDSLEAIGRCCPHLISFRFIKQEGRIGDKSDDEAFVIAKTMPKLCHLELLGNTLTNDGLLAILDGCHHLQSLHLQYCFNVDLQGSLKKRCDEQIKDLVYLNDNPYDDHDGDFHNFLYDYYNYNFDFNDYDMYDSDYEAFVTEMAPDDRFFV